MFFTSLFRTRRTNRTPKTASTNRFRPRLEALEGGADAYVGEPFLGPWG